MLSSNMVAEKYPQLSIECASKLILKKKKKKKYPSHHPAKHDLTYSVHLDFVHENEIELLRGKLLIIMTVNIFDLIQ